MGKNPVKKVLAMAMALVLVVTGIMISPTTAEAAVKEVTSVKLNKKSVSVQRNKSITLKATVRPTNASNKKVTWSSSDKKVASVNRNGKVTGKRVGSTRITVTARDGSKKSATCVVGVYTAKIKTAKISKTSLSLQVGKRSGALSVKVTPKGASNAYTWKSKNTKIATVDIRGRVTGKKAGKTTITGTPAAPSKGKKKTVTCTVKVKQPVTGIRVKPTAASLKVGGKQSLTASVSPRDASNKKVNWSITNGTGGSGVVSLSSAASNSGKAITVTAKKAGTATVVAKANGKTARCTFTVTAVPAPATVPVTGVKLSDSSLSLISNGSGTDKSRQLTATVEPVNATNKEVSWTAADPNVATVSNNGVVTAAGTGKTTITVTTKDGGKTAVCTVNVTATLQEASNTIENPSFETGDLTGWTIVEGTAFSDASVSDAETWWGEEIPYNKHGTYHLDGWRGEGEGATGVLRSSTFTLEGSGFITFRLGAGKDTSKIFIRVIDAVTGELIARYGNTEFADINFPSIENGMRLANMVEYKASLSQYLGKDLYIEIVDHAVSDWGLVFADEFNTFYESEPQGQISATNLYNPYTEDPYRYNIKNHNFEIPDLEGWENKDGIFGQAKEDIVGREGEGYLKSTVAGTGELRSQEFTLGGTGNVSVLIGGEGSGDKLYAGLYLSETDELIHKFPVTGDEGLTIQEKDLSDYLLQKMYVCVVDNDNEGHILLDDINLYGRGVIAHWSFDENSGKYAGDTVSSRQDFIEYVFHNAVYTKPQDPQWRSNGVKGGSLIFDGFSSYMEREKEFIEQPADALTIEAWVAPRVYEWGDGGKLSAIVSQYNKERTEGYILGMYRHGTWSLQMGIDGSWVEVFCEDKPLEKYKWNYVAATFDKGNSTAKLYLNGELVKEQAMPLNKGITPSSENLRIGRDSSAISLATVFHFNMFSGLMDEIKIHNTALSDAQVGTLFAEYTDGKSQVPTLAAEDIDVDESVYEGDKDRPQYHAIPPGNWMNESHAPMYYNGKYHLFYQSNPQGPYWHQIHWGHWVSDDMVHWENVRPALSPEKGDLDPDGIWSGSAAYDRDGNPVLFYTAGNDSASPNQSVAIATPKDLGDVYLTEWEKETEPVIVQEEGIGVFGEFRDPFVWFDEEEDMWFALVTSGMEEREQGTALVYTSGDMSNWEYKGHLMDEDVSEYTYLGTVWELPVLLSIGADSGGNEKYVFFVTPCRDEADVEVNYWVGSFDKKTCKFVPDSIEPKCLDLGDGYLTAQCGFETPDGRTVLYSIVQNVRTPQAEYESGWAHTNSLPIEISYDNGDLKISPIEELESLRMDKLADMADKNLDEANEIIKDIQGDMLEIKIEFENKNEAKKFGISVRKSPESEEKTDLYYDVENGGFFIDRDKTSLDPDARSYGVQGGKVELNGENVTLHLYLDRSIIECFINDNKKLTTRVYPMRYDSLGLELFSDKDITIKSMEVWDMNALDGTVAPVYKNKYWDTTVYPNTEPLLNHDFATGDLTGWTATGNAFTDANVSTQEKFWDTIYFNPSRRFPGGYHLWGFHEANGGDAATGTLTSQEFILGGNGNIDFLVSGGKDIENLYVALVRVSDGAELFKQTGFDYEEYIRIRWDASEYIDEKLCIKVVDNSTGGFGHINVDDFNLLQTIM